MDVVLILIAAVDVPFQLWSSKQKLMMTKQEVRDEYKDSEGKPEVKQRIRQLQRDMAERRMEIDAVLNRNRREASALALQGTPAFIINGNLIPGGMPQAYLEAVIARIRSGEPLR